jgi:endonuclease III
LVGRRLRKVYGEPSYDPLPLGNLPDPLEELVYILLTVKTAHVGYYDLYMGVFKRAFPTWGTLEHTGAKRVADAIKIAGLSNQKAAHIKGILRRLRDDFGQVSLDPLRSMSTPDAEAYLLSLPGVGKKVARCVLMYSLRRSVFPVDTHVLRVMKRLGLADPNLSRAKSHDTLQAMIPPRVRFQLHVNLVKLGRETCVDLRPKCPQCVLADRCLTSPMRQDSTAGLPPYRR